MEKGRGMRRGEGKGKGERRVRTVGIVFGNSECLKFGKSVGDIGTEWSKIMHSGAAEHFSFLSHVIHTWCPPAQSGTGHTFREHAACQYLVEVEGQAFRRYHAAVAVHRAVGPLGFGDRAGSTAVMMSWHLVRATRIPAKSCRREGLDHSHLP